MTSDSEAGGPPSGEEPSGAGDDAPGGTSRGLLQDLVDYGIYAPLGAAIRVAESLPGLVEKGRAQVESRVSTARVVGRFAVREARRRVERSAGANGPPAGAPPEEPEHAEAQQAEPQHAEPQHAEPQHAEPPASDPPPSPATPADEAPAAHGDERPAGFRRDATGVYREHTATSRREGPLGGENIEATPGAAPVSAGTAPSGTGAQSGIVVETETPVGAESLAIPNYDSLAASQVVPRLASLSADELEAIRRYEAGHRRRRTVLNRVAQLQDGQAGAAG